MIASRSGDELQCRVLQRDGVMCLIHTVSCASLGWMNGVNSGNRCLGIVESDFRSNVSSSNQI